MRRNMWTDLVEVDRPFTDLFRGFGIPWAFRPGMTATPGRPYLPTADVFARNGDLVVRVELPGIDPDKDVTVTLEEGELTVKGERKAETEVKEEGYYRKESTFGYFERHFAVPEGTKASDIKATYIEGVLEIAIPKAAAPAAKPKTNAIPVTTRKPVKA
jgi:HSP20 family protein